MGLLALSAAAMAGRLWAAQEAAVDLSSPRATLETIYNAMRAGDVATVKACLIFEDADAGEVFDCSATQVCVPLRLMHAMEKLFGAPAADKPFDLSAEKSIDQALERIKSVEIAVNGETAVVTEKKGDVNPNAETELTGVTLQHADGKWKVVASTFPDSGGDVSPKQLGADEINAGCAGGGMSGDDGRDLIKGSFIRLTKPMLLIRHSFSPPRVPRRRRVERAVASAKDACMEIVTTSVERTLGAGGIDRSVGSAPNTRIALHGNLGAGKTHLTRGIAVGARVDDPSLVSSPTYVLLNVYRGPKPVFHMDAYRVESEEDFAMVGFEELLKGGGLAVVEWAEKVGHLLPAERVEIVLEHGEVEESRVLTLSATGEGPERFLKVLAEGWADFKREG